MTLKLLNLGSSALFHCVYCRNLARNEPKLLSCLHVACSKCVKDNFNEGQLICASCSAACSAKNVSFVLNWEWFWNPFCPRKKLTWLFSFLGGFISRQSICTQCFRHSKFYIWWVLLLKLLLTVCFQKNIKSSLFLAFSSENLGDCTSCKKCVRSNQIIFTPFLENSLDANQNQSESNSSGEYICSSCFDNYLKSNPSTPLVACVAITNVNMIEASENRPAYCVRGHTGHNNNLGCFCMKSKRAMCDVCVLPPHGTTHKHIS